MIYGKYKPAREDIAANVLKPPPPLTPAQRARAEKMRDEWRDAFNGDDSFIRNMVEALIHGWRNVMFVTPIEDQKNGND
ncbi:hypothetical protein [Paludibacterium denitrificans]|uniref:Uncharacterized protein n=1 Tax=Paludibacterium denitrificans TaxID=2675226 RepID=A0A844GAL7_9NEIS|nr:hypothetical protein [Paludibacterium denitrificans]MTD32390.1 hypothetical protein [Paludibacterium denitrificans]